ncbi:MAG: mercury(II) reductase [Candidatus Lambdaproteobacteria bacterium]|nr:mercury(II) reductase [Candidatus Lambdaproteobacteria bacterium]
MQAPDELELKISGMTCDACAAHVTKALQGTSGVAHVNVPGWRSGKALVKVETSADPSALTAAVEAAGYGASVATRRADAPLRPARASKDGIDLMVIGAGSAGFAAAIKAAELGFSAAIVEAGTVGGTCVNVGCVPSKTLLRAVEAHHLAGHGRFRGVHTESGALDWAELMRHKDEFVSELRQAKYVDVLAAYPSIRYIQGHAVLRGGNAVEVAGASYRPGKIVIATGASPWAAPIPGLQEAGFLDSTGALALDKRPESLLVIGANAVGLELAQLFARAGTQVTVLEALPRIAPFEDEAISEALTGTLREERIGIHVGVRIERVAKPNGRYELNATVDGRASKLEAEQLLVATGRRPNSAGFGLADAGVTLGERGAVQVNEFLQTGNPDIYAAGDVTGRDMFVYVAAYAGSLAAENALTGSRRIFDTGAMARVTFTDPQVASAGLTEQQAREAGHDIKVSVLPMSYVPRALAARDTRGLVKLVADRKTDRVLGAHVLAPEAAEIVQPAVLAMKFGITVRELGGTLFPYLTSVEALKLAVQTFDKDVSKLSCCAG